MEAHDGGRVQTSDSAKIRNSSTLPKTITSALFLFPASSETPRHRVLPTPHPKTVHVLPTQAPILLTPIPTHIFSALFTIILPRPTKVRSGAAQARGTLLVHDRPALLTGRTTAVRRHGWRRRRQL
jgi:hypothetical protein